jgi:hypothetical protein
MLRKQEACCGDAHTCPPESRQDIELGHLKYLFVLQAPYKREASSFSACKNEVWKSVWL